MAAPLMQMENISKSFGATHALRGVSLSLSAGEIVALIGENGAGKSTLMKVLSGAVRPDSGEMHLAGEIYAPRGPSHAQRAGVAMIYQELNLAPDLSVEDNIMLGQERHRFGWIKRSTQHARVREVLTELGHPQLRPEVPVGGLSVAAQQLVEIARALVTEAKVLVFDEPTSSLTQHDVQTLFEVIRNLRQRGLGIIYISHFLEEIQEVCDRYTVLRDGEVAGNGKMEGTTEAEIVSLMVGRSVDQLFPAVPHEPGEVLLSLDELSGKQSPQDVSFELRRGEILGIAGLVGAGRTELLRCLMALDPVRKGTLKIAEVKTRHTPQARIRAGMGLVSEDRKAEGLAQDRSIADNLTLSHLKPYSRFGWLNLSRRLESVGHWMQKLQIKAESPLQEIHQLSGGNQQKVAIARVMHQDADILLLDEPTRGIDVGTKAEIYRLMGELAASGKAILFVSSYFIELFAVCDRVGIMARGRLREIRPSSEWTEETALACAIGSDDSET